ncbi:MAG: hypothetical protein AAGU27_10450 [Dehalobacterium sp.]
MAFLKREDGAVTPYIPLGVFQMRLPFIHLKWEWPEAIQAVFLNAVAFGALPVLTECLGLPYEVCITMIALQTMTYILHPLFGDPCMPGWITPAIPLTLAFAAGFEPGPDRVHAVMALQYLMAFIFIFLGITGLANKVVAIVPTSMRAGILMGAGISAMVSVIQPGGRMENMPVSAMVGTFVSYMVFYSVIFQRLAKKNKIIQGITKLGMLPGIIVALIIGPLIGELEMPIIEWGFIDWRLGDAFRACSVFAIGLPSIDYFIKAIPMAIAAYIIAYGDFVFAETVVKEADSIRVDEKIHFSPARSNLISGARNLFFATICPYPTLNGPLWGGVQISITERYKQGRKQMDSVHSGIMSFAIAMAIGSILLPIVTGMKPVMPIAYIVTLTIQAYACCYMAMQMLKNREQMGICACMALFLAFKGAAWGLAVGILLHFMIGQLKQEPTTKFDSKQSVSG